MRPHRTAFLAASLAVAVVAAPAAAQLQPVPPLSAAEIITLARIHVAVSAAHDTVNKQLAQQRNKKDDLQAALQDSMRKHVAVILQKNGLSDAEYKRRTFLVSTSLAARQTFDSAVVAITGAPIPGVLAAAPAAPMVPVPEGPVGTHVGHVVNSFGDTPNRQGLLAVAMGEARVAAQHAGLATRQPTNLAYMKTHVGHVLHALDPEVERVGPGLGYGLKKAAAAVAAHIELAAAADGATAAHKLHAGHVATSARNTVARVDQLIALAHRVQESTDASQAAGLVTQIASLAEELIAGADANGDGRVTWDRGEGGLQHCDEHVRLMLGGGR